MEKEWNIKVYKGNYSKSNYDVFAVKITSPLISEASKVFLLSDITLKFSAVVKPFLASVGLINRSTEGDIKEKIQNIIEDVDDNNKVITGVSIDELLSDGMIENKDIEKYYNNISNFINKNKELFAERGDIVPFDSQKDKNCDEDFDSIYDKKIHLGAALTGLEYRNKFLSPDDIDDKSVKLVAVRTEQFKKLADVDMERYQIKDIIYAFCEKKYILKGNESTTIEKDITLSRGNQERCYVLKIQNEV